MLVYLVTNDVNGKMYVGKTSKTLERRWSRHLSSARRGSNFHLYRAIRKHGVAHFSIKTLGTASTDQELSDLEQKWVRDLRTTEPAVGYNMTAGGEGMTGWKHRAETRTKMSITATGQHRTTSQAQRDAVSKAHKGIPKPQAQRDKMAAHWDEARRDKQGEIALRVNAIENAKLKDYLCPDCSTIFKQVPKGVYGGHRKACLNKHHPDRKLHTRP